MLYTDALAYIRKHSEAILTINEDKVVNGPVLGRDHTNKTWSVHPFGLSDLH